VNALNCGSDYTEILTMYIKVEIFTSWSYVFQTLFLVGGRSYSVKGRCCFLLIFLHFKKAQTAFRTF